MSDIALALTVCFAPVLVIFAGIAVADHVANRRANRRAYDQVMAVINRPIASSHATARYTPTREGEHAHDPQVHADPEH